MCTRYQFSAEGCRALQRILELARPLPGQSEIKTGEDVYKRQSLGGEAQQLQIDLPLDNIKACLLYTSPGCKYNNFSIIAQPARLGKETAKGAVTSRILNCGLDQNVMHL